VIIKNTQADIWVVQKGTLGPYAEPSTLHDDLYRTIKGLPGIAEAGNILYLTMQVRLGPRDVRVMLAGFEPGHLGEPTHFIAGRPIARTHYEAIADEKTGFSVGDRILIRRKEFTVVGLTQRMVSSGGDPMLFVTLKDAQEIQFLKESEAVQNDRSRLAANPRINRPGVPGLLEAVEENLFSNQNVNAVLVRVAPGWEAEAVARNIRRWKHLQAYTQEGMQEILVAKLIALASKQIGLFLVILTIVSGAIVALTIYTMTMGKIKEIAILKLVGTKNRTISGMILQEALGLGIIGFILGKIAATLWAPVFPRYVLLETADAVRAFFLSLIICALASLLAIRAALKADPASAIGG
jgi:putative ABC transport system permease protein